MKKNWIEFLSLRQNRNELYISVVLIAAVLFSLTTFLNYVELREGIIISDPFLKIVTPVDLTWLIFGLIYISLITAIISLVPKPPKLLFALQVYSVMVLLRIIAMYLLPLNPPADTIILKDPLVEFFGTGKTLTKDLFFSGHTATLFLLFLISERKFLKYIFIIATIFVGISVLLQHIHYTIDVFAAPFFAYSAFRGTWMLKKINFHRS